MSREIRGQIYKVAHDYKIISIQIVDKLEFFYLQPRFVKQFRNYLYSGVFVSFICEEEKFKMRNRRVSRIIAFEKIFCNRYRHRFSYFDQKDIRKNILNKINKYQYRLFLDLEMTLQHSKHAEEEIIQAGAILVNQDNQVVFKFNQYIKPTKINQISNRTLQFLNINKNKIKSGMSYKKFAKIFRKIIEKYRPCVIVWGNNDKKALEKSYNINRIKPIFVNDDFINLQLLLKQYYNFNYELGLFATAKIFNIECGRQNHNAYDDAKITHLIFNQFYQYAKNNLEFPFIKEMKKNLT